MMNMKLILCKDILKNNKCINWNDNYEVKYYVSIKYICGNSIVFSNDKNYKINSEIDAVYVLPNSSYGMHSDIKNSVIIYSEYPKLTYALIVRCLFEETRKSKVFFEDSIQDEIIGPKIYEKNNIKIGHNTFIGGEGFAVQDKTIVPHLAHVRIFNNVSISNNCNIDRGFLEDTIIGENTKLDAMCHVGHGTIIGKGCILCAGTTLSGSCRIGDNVFFGVNSCVKDNINIGNNVVIGIGAVVIRDVKDNEVVIGNPAKVLVK